MAILLALETSTTVCSVALSVNGEIISQRQTDLPNSHAQTLTVFVDEVMKESHLSYSKLDAIAVSEGPGSYTGLRIGVSTAKGLCYALSKPLISVSTLQTMTQQVLGSHKPLNESVVLVPMIDARRMEVYSAHFNALGEMIRNVVAEIIDESSYLTLLEKNEVVFFGNGAEKLKDTIVHPQGLFIDGIVPLAKDMVSLADKKYGQGEFVDLAYFEPFYLKDFMVSLPKNKVF